MVFRFKKNLGNEEDRLNKGDRPYGNVGGGKRRTTSGNSGSISLW